MIGDLSSRIRPGLKSLSGKLGVAVSGGGDSVALLHLLAHLPNAPALHAVTVDHRLRPESADEIRMVTDLCGGLGIECTALRWDEGPGAGNLQARARDARYRLIGSWATQHSIGTVALGHTLDDQAETVVMRMARASGVGGLAAMRPVREVAGLRFVRPLLSIARHELREYLLEHGINWCEDPGNDDPRFERTRVRRTLPQLGKLGIGATVLARIATHMAQADDALETYALDAGLRVAHTHLGDVVFDGTGFDDLPEEIRRRLLTKALTWVAKPGAPPRGASLVKVLRAVRNRKTATLVGCVVYPCRDSFRVGREFAAVRDLRVAFPEIWDRWRLSGPAPPGSEIAALGPEGLAQCGDWRRLNTPRPALLAGPAIWRGSELIAAPLAGRSQGIDAVPVRGFNWIDPATLALNRHR